MRKYRERCAFFFVKLGVSQKYSRSRKKQQVNADFIPAYRSYLQQARLSLLARGCFTEMAEGVLRGHAALGGALYESYLYQVGFVYFLERLPFLAHSNRQAGRAHGAASKLNDERVENQPVHVVQPEVVYAQQLQGGIGHITRNYAVALDLGEIADTAQQAIGDARGAPRARRYLERAVRLNGHVQNAGGTIDDTFQFLGRVQIESARIAKPRP